MAERIAGKALGLSVEQARRYLAPLAVWENLPLMGIGAVMYAVLNAAVPAEVKALLGLVSFVSSIVFVALHPQYTAGEKFKIMTAALAANAVAFGLTLALGLMTGAAVPFQAQVLIQAAAVHLGHFVWNNLTYWRAALARNRAGTKEQVDIVTHYVDGADPSEVVQNTLSVRDTYAQPLQDGPAAQVHVVVASQLPREIGSAWENLGQGINGQPVWVSSEKNILVIACQGAPLAAIEDQVINKGVCTSGRWFPDSRLVRRLQDVLGRLGVAKGPFSHSISIDHTGTTQAITYDVDGRMIVPSAYFGVVPTLESNTRKLPELLKIKRSHERQAKEQVYFRDSSSNPKELIDSISFLNGPTSGNIIIQPAVFDGFEGDAKNAKIEAVGQCVAEAGRGRLAVYVDLSEAASSEVEALQKQYNVKGFAGYLTREGEETKIHQYGGGRTIAAKVIQEKAYEDIYALKAAVSFDRGFAQILDVEKLMEAIKKQRSAVDQMTIAAFMDDLLKDDERLTKQIKEQIKGLDPKTMNAILSAA
jgi:hypothetical protein